MRQFTKLNTEVEQTITLGEWKRHREAEYQRVQDQKKKKKEQTEGEHQ